MGRVTDLIDGIVVKGCAVGNILPTDGVVHVGLDTARGDGVDGDLLVTKVWSGKMLES